MYRFDYNPEEFNPQDIAEDLGLKLGVSKRGFYLGTQLVGYLVKEGLIRFGENLASKIKASVCGE
jgi:hypothetical protein